MISKYRGKSFKKLPPTPLRELKAIFSPKPKGFVSRKLPTSKEAVGRTDNANIKIRKADQVSASFSMRARRQSVRIKPNRFIRDNPDKSKSIMHRRSFFIVYIGRADFLFSVNIGI